MPQPLSHSSSRVLEFDAFRDWLAGFSQSVLGRARASSLQPTNDRVWIERQQQLTQEIRAYLRAGGSFDFSGLTDPGTLLSKSRIQGAALETEDIRSALYVAERAAEWR